MLSLLKVYCLACIFSTTLICFTSAQQAPVYNRRLFDVSTFRSMFPFRNGKAVPFQVGQAQQFLPLLKKSDAKWEDLGWAWGKRSNDEYFLPSSQTSSNGAEEGAAAGGVIENEAEGALKNPHELINERQTRSMKQVKKNPDWHDLGWAWGKK